MTYKDVTARYGKALRCHPIDFREAGVTEDTFAIARSKGKDADEEA